MPNYDYNLNLPNPPNDPSDDAPLMQINTNSAGAIIAEDHNGYGVNNGGFHTVIRSDPQGRVWNPTTVTGAPAPLAGFQKTFSMNYLPDAFGAVVDTQLFSMTGLGGVSQLTGNNAATRGYAWLGGILVQWGNVKTAVPGGFPTVGTSGTEVFKQMGNNCITFPKTLFNVFITPIFTPIANPLPPPPAFITPVLALSSFYVADIYSKDEFFWAFKSQGTFSNVTGFNWVAIGN